jgi:hypothetical protein
MPISARARYILSWLLALGTAAGYLYFSWHHFDDPTRPDGNRGHTYIDFGGQYLLGRVLVRGQGQHIYHRSVQRSVLEEAYPRQKESPGQKTSDADGLMRSFMGEDQEDGSVSIGGPLYPPIHALWFYPFAWLSPQTAYRFVQCLIIVGAFTAGLGLAILSRSRVWWPLASLAVIVFPGFASSLGLGQNSVFSLNVLIWGWALMSVDRPVCGGLVLGLLAFKPVWAAAFLLFPIWTGRWRVAVAMAASGLGQVALTLPLVGVHGWQDWLHVSQEAMQVSEVDEMWILRSRHVLTLPRRWLDFDSPVLDKEAAQLANRIGWAIWVTVVVATTAVAVLQKRRGVLLSAVGSAFFLLGAMLSCIHFMYYDVLLAALPVFLLYIGPRLPSWPFHIPLAILLLAPTVPALKLAEPPTETWCLLVLWALSGWSWVRHMNVSTTSP